MSWRVAKSLETLRDQVNAASPKRVKSSDGTIGDAAHASRSSDHNPWVKDGSMGVVTAMDITHDPQHGIDCEKMAASITESRDPRLKYIIWNSRIWNPSRGLQWRPYTGVNPHNKHMHISVKSVKDKYDDPTRWRIGSDVGAYDPAAGELPPPMPLLLPGAPEDKNVDLARKLAIKYLQKEEGYGPLMESLIRAIQTKGHLVSDAKIGEYTWDYLVL